MADSTEEDKVNAALAKEVEEPKVPAEPEEKPEDRTDSKDETPEETPAPAEEETTTEEPEEETPPSTFTKPEGYEWVKGDTLEEFNQNLITAYENSTKEALRLRQAAQPQAPAASPAPTGGQPQFDINSIPEIQMLRAEQQSKMIDAFDDFAKKYPQAREPQSFDQFEKASAGASQAFASAFGRVPTYPELFEKTAQLLGWQASDKNTARKDAAIKEAGASTGTSTPTAAPPKASPFSAKSLEIARRIPGNESKSDADLVKELTAAVAA